MLQMPPQVFLDHMAEIVRGLEERQRLTDCRYFIVCVEGNRYRAHEATEAQVQEGIEVSDSGGRLAAILKQPLLPGRVRFLARIEVDGVVMYGTGDTHDGCWFYAERQPQLGELS